jgi:hypothetical protein
LHTIYLREHQSSAITPVPFLDSPRNTHIAATTMNTGSRELLRPLVPSQLKPECSSPREFAVLRLREVGVVRITQERAGSNVDARFTVSVSPAVASSSSTGRQSDQTSASCGSNFVNPTELLSSPTTPTEHGSVDKITANKRLVDFVALRTKVYSLAGTSHKGEACAFCKQALRCALWSESLYFHRNAAALSGLRDDKLLATLVAILSGLVKLCTPRIEHESNSATTSPRSVCRCQQQLPVVVHAFLSGSHM